MEGIAISATSVQSLRIADTQTRDALFCAMTDYAEDGTVPDLGGFGLAQQMVWPFLKEDVDRQRARYEQDAVDRERVAVAAAAAIQRVLGMEDTSEMEEDAEQVYFIGLDLKSVTIRPDFLEQIEQYPRRVQLNNRAWLIRTSETKSKIIARLLSRLCDGDAVCVIPVDPYDMATGGVNMPSADAIRNALEL